MKQNCNKYSDKEIFRYLQSRFSPQEVEDFHVHIMSCKYCYDQVSILGDFVDRLEEEQEEEQEEIEHPTTGTQKVKRLIKPTKLLLFASVAALVAALAFAIYSKFRSTDDELQDIQYHNQPKFHSIDTLKNETDTLDVTEHLKDLHENKNKKE